MLLFISHCDLHGVTEASYSGVPILGIPFFADQEFNLRFVEQIGTGITILQKDVTKEIILTAINKILDNRRYDILIKNYCILCMYTFNEFNLILSSL